MVQKKVMETQKLCFWEILYKIKARYTMEHIRNRFNEMGFLGRPWKI